MTVTPTRLAMPFRAMGSGGLAESGRVAGHRPYARRAGSLLRGALSQPEVRRMEGFSRAASLLTAALMWQTGS